jgi:hypothetical protein
MNIHYLQHVPFEGLGSIVGWIRRGGPEIGATPRYSFRRAGNDMIADWRRDSSSPRGAWACGSQHEPEPIPGGMGDEAEKA